MTGSSSARTQMIVAVFFGCIVGGLATWWLVDTPEITKETEKTPLYWVAPMDPNFRRDQPGKSPMGMDLVPVYAEDNDEDSGAPGVISISPTVVNNLGVRTTQAVLTSVQHEINTVGYVQYDENKLIHIHPRVSGWVERLYVKAAGNPTVKSKPLYSLYSPELVNAQEEYVLALNRGEKRLIAATEDRLRALEIPERFINQLKKTRNIDQTVTFYAPISGVVDNLNIREGFYVQPGTTMLSVGSLDTVWVEAELFASQVSRVKVGDEAIMTLDYYPGKTWTGRLDYLYPVLNAQTRTVRVRLRFNNADRKLKPHMFARIVISPAVSEPKLVIPFDALIQTGDKDRVVLDLGEGRFKSIEVVVGVHYGDQIEIIDGLRDGDDIVTSAQFLLDSESSKISDFRRMLADVTPASVWVGGEILEVIAGERRVLVKHDEVAAWQWPEMTMALSVGDQVDITELSPGTTLHMELTKDASGSVEISKTHVMSVNNDATESHHSSHDHVKDRQDN